MKQLNNLIVVSTSHYLSRVNVWMIILPVMFLMFSKKVTQMNIDDYTIDETGQELQQIFEKRIRNVVIYYVLIVLSSILVAHFLAFWGFVYLVVFSVAFLPYTLKSRHPRCPCCCGKYEKVLVKDWFYKICRKCKKYVPTIMGVE